MKPNMGTADRAIRIIVAILIGILYFTGKISGTLAIVLGIVAVLLLLTSFVGFCMLYRILGISTRKQA